MSTKNAAIARRYFSATVEPDKWQCKIGKQLIKRKDCGSTNLINHIKSQHPEYATEDDLRQTSMASYLVTNPGHKIGRSAINVPGWIEWVCQGLKPLYFVEDPLTRITKPSKHDKTYFAEIHRPTNERSRKDNFEESTQSVLFSH